MSSAGSFDTALDRHLTAVRERDRDTFAATIADDVVVVLGNGKVLQGRDEVIAFHDDWFGDPDWSLTAETVASTVRDHVGTALCRIEYRDVDPEGEPIELSYLLGLTLARTEGDEWLLVHDQNTFF